MLDLKQLINENGNIYPIKPYNIFHQKIYLFNDNLQQVEYKLLTDGDIDHINTWIDKKPYEKDSFLEGCSSMKRYEFILDNANILLVEKKKKDCIVKNLYIDNDTLYKIINNYLYQISINERGNIKIKKMEKLI